MAAIKNKETVSELSQHYGVHPNMITTRKRPCSKMLRAYLVKAVKHAQNADAQVDQRHRQIGKLKVEKDILSRKLGF